MHYTDPNTIYPITNINHTVFLKNIIKNPQIIVGDYTYYDDPEDVHHFKKNVLYLFDFIGDKLIIGKFCQIASGARFIMNGATHPLTGISTYPLKIFGGEWSKAPLNPVIKGNTIIGNDVWIGNGATFMPGVRIGDGAIIGANSVVTKDVEPYTIVGGNPAQTIRKRFKDEEIQFLLNLKWWDWTPEKLSENVDALASGDWEKLKNEY